MSSIMPVIINAKQTTKTVIKTYPAFDQVTYGGLTLGSSTLIVGKTGGFKSGTLHNVLLAATLNNERDKFDVPAGRVPTVFYFSLENSIRQLYERHAAYFCTEAEIAATKLMDEETLANFVGDLTVKHGAKLTIIYEDRNGMVTSMSDIIARISEYEQQGYHPVLLGIDYLTKLTPDDPVYRSYTDTGAEGTKKQAKKSEEIRKYLLEKNVAGVIPEQLATDGVKAIELLRGDSRNIDPLYHTTVDMIAHSRGVATEFENIIFVYKYENRRICMDTNASVLEEFIGHINKKSRDAKVGYTPSPRDIINMPLYDLRIKRLKNSSLRDTIKDTGEIHVVSPLENYRISMTDYAKSIIMYYTNETADYVNLKDLMASSVAIVESVDSALSGCDLTSLEKQLGL